ncbi:hypothetical protein ABC977_02020 [Thioalkalicoccus limnaeus]|uniref:DUF4868 domain-containing protein n=1 Tax=Thioalkalicoccus limnaeus TaxID=120681 RepID=A0ABV4BB44_9GAMM
MIDNFQLAAIAKQAGRYRLLRVPLHQGLQNTLAETWQQQYDAFVDGVLEIEFNAGYQPEAHECFRLAGYQLPAWLAGENSHSAADFATITHDDALLDVTKGLVAFARDAEDNELILFQNFSRSHVIRPGRFLFLTNDTYETTARPGLTLADKLSAIYLPTEFKLLFRSFRTVNTFLPLANYYEEASEQEIREVLHHDLLDPEDAGALATGANQWFRKRFAMLRDSGVLDEYTASQIQARSSGYDVEIRVAADRILFPADKTAAKKLLQFLNEEIFRGAITNTLYETNSRREAD